MSKRPRSPVVPSSQVSGSAIASDDLRSLMATPSAERNWDDKAIPECPECGRRVKVKPDGTRYRHVKARAVKKWGVENEGWCGVEE